MSFATQHDLSELPVKLEAVWDEQEEDTLLLTFSTSLEEISGFLELHAEPAGEVVSSWWRWVVTEPEGEEGDSGSEDSLYVAAARLKVELKNMLATIRSR